MILFFLILQEGSARLWGFLLAVYWVSVVSYYLLWKAYKHVSDLRAAALMSSKVVPEQFAVLVRDVPPAQGQTIKEQVDTYFKNIYPDTFYRSLIVTDNKEVSSYSNPPQLILRFDCFSICWHPH